MPCMKLQRGLIVFVFLAGPVFFSGQTGNIERSEVVYDFKVRQHVVIFCVELLGRRRNARRADCRRKT